MQKTWKPKINTSPCQSPSKPANNLLFSHIIRFWCFSRNIYLCVYLITYLFCCEIGLCCIYCFIFCFLNLALGCAYHLFLKVLKHDLEWLHDISLCESHKVGHLDDYFSHFRICTSTWKCWATAYRHFYNLMQTAYCLLAWFVPVCTSCNRVWMCLFFHSLYRTGCHSFSSGDDEVSDQCCFCAMELLLEFFFFTLALATWNRMCFFTFILTDHLLLIISLLSCTEACG